MGETDVTKRRYLSPGDVARILSVSVKTVQRWCRAGEVSAVRVHDRGAWRIPVAALREKFAMAHGEEET